MLEAEIIKAVVVADDKTGGTVLMAVARYYDDMVNIKVKYDWDTMDRTGFCSDLKEKLAEAFDLPAHRIDIKEKSLLGKMKEYHEYNKVKH